MRITHVSLYTTDLYHLNEIPSEVRKKQISVGKLRNKLAREVAREHLKQEFKVLNVHNYLILD